MRFSSVVNAMQCCLLFQLYHLVKEYGNNLFPENLGKVKSAAGFLKMLEGFRRATKKELLILFKDSNERIL